MRLLRWNSNGELSLTPDLHEDEIPPYAILSHTWGADRDEVTFADLQQNRGQDKAGYAKIKFCGEQARKDQVEYFWVDTCCINKDNHVELSRAITSMFRWYRDAVKCYVYLSDVPAVEHDNERNYSGNSLYQWEIDFRNCKWFTRGWTLQELLAPKVVLFFSREKEILGDKTMLAQQIHEITTIPIAALHGTALAQFSIDERIRWTQRRQTKEKEDKAYCLLGIFEVFMPLIYGEGDNALRRLRKEINDQYGKDVAAHLSESEDVSRRRETSANNNDPRSVALPPLLIAAASPSVIVLERALSSTHNVDMREDGPGKRNALHIAVVANQAPNVSLLLSSGVDVHAKASGGITPLHLACMMGRAEIVKILIRDGQADANARDENLNTPLHAAAVNNQVETTRVLLDHGADPWLVESSGWNVFHVATHLGNRELFQVLEQATVRQADTT
ncbi:hypothetical protein H2198_000504 [Neophaeococcomyces mojaviensis]|uniref:Uncharacterized protein n=1 Tax=Neophaeococcomyces mojaviensis TaxID=3383035 RepID=A0ACC3AJJ8_9EURO|nr:hypothetical protein H2198_000504 [Knufia sp. JES_112]